MCKGSSGVVTFRLKQLFRGWVYLANKNCGAIPLPYFRISLHLSCETEPCCIQKYEQEENSTMLNMKRNYLGKGEMG